jgi:hypothetical protein
MIARLDWTGPETDEEGDQGDEDGDSNLIRQGRQLLAIVHQAAA